ncbi:MAG TPA: ABC transporter ATP-binding protein [Armatimonadota bacterium]|nr:ABC transporter ATP-binding protein [Armatimonadota bacterium]
MIAIEQLVKRYGEVTAVDGLCLALPAGRIHGLLGPNGAGKTTTLRILSTLTSPTAGTASVAGFDVVKHPLQVKRQLGVVQQTLNFDPELTARESLLVHGMLYGMSRVAIRARSAELLAFVELEDAAHRGVSTYSGGMKRRLSIARALMHAPRVILLDEPTVGLDAFARRKVWDLIRRLRDAGSTVVLTTHYIEEVEMLADHVAVIDRGRLIADGSPRALIEGVGAIAVDCMYPAGTQVAFFDTREAAAAHVAAVQVSATIRQANLEDVFLQLTGRHVNPAATEGVAPHATGHGRRAARAHHS